MIESEEPGYKALYRAEAEARKNLARQVADLTKRLSDAALDEKPCFAVIHSK